jgi:hypothetical protein
MRQRSHRPLPCARRRRSSQLTRWRARKNNNCEKGGLGGDTQDPPQIFFALSMQHAGIGLMNLHFGRKLIVVLRVWTNFPLNDQMSNDRMSNVQMSNDQMSTFEMSNNGTSKSPQCQILQCRTLECRTL